MEVTDRFKGLDLIECQNCAWSFLTLYRRWPPEPPPKKKCKKAKWLSEEALEIAEKKKRSERKRKKGKIYPTECRVPECSKDR